MGFAGPCRFGGLSSPRWVEVVVVVGLLCWSCRLALVLSAALVVCAPSAAGAEPPPSFPQVNESSAVRADRQRAADLAGERERRGGAAAREQRGRSRSAYGGLDRGGARQVPGS